MTPAEKEAYSSFFKELTGHRPHDYQVEVANLLFDGRNIILRAPTGAGKTMAVLAPFLSPHWSRQPTKLIYALPLRTLAQGIFNVAQQAARDLGRPIEPVVDEKGRETVPPFVTLQTGEQPDDPFLDRGTIIVTTYDQVLSGLLCGPYGLSDRLHNVNASAVAGALVIFDEFHLMPVQRAFLTGAAGLHLFRSLSQSVWMTATATPPLEEVLRESLEAKPIPAGKTEFAAMLASLPSVTEVKRKIVRENGPLSAERILACHATSSIVLANTVGRAQRIFVALRDLMKARGDDTKLRLLHSRFFKNDRTEKERLVESWFGSRDRCPAILVATQVIEAGIDISCEHLHTEICPMNALVQRAGRCARFRQETGTVHVYDLPDESGAWLPYDDPNAAKSSVLNRTGEVLRAECPALLDPATAARWVERVHTDDDREHLNPDWCDRVGKSVELIQKRAIARQKVRVSHLVRGDDDDSIRVIIARDPSGIETPSLRDGFNLRRRAIARLLGQRLELGWYWTGEHPQPWNAITSPSEIYENYALCLRPEVAAYDAEMGLRLGEMGSVESPRRILPPRPGHAPPLKVETWADHALRVADQAIARFEREVTDCDLVARGLETRYGTSPRAIREAMVACALLHDLGKLQEDWQKWAREAMRLADADRPYRYVAALAHTDFNPDDPRDRAREHAMSIRRPAHAPASAYYAHELVKTMLPSCPSSLLSILAAACLAAVLAHHGGWVPPPDKSGSDMGVGSLDISLASAIQAAIEGAVTSDVLRLQKATNKRRFLDRALKPATHPDHFSTYWPLVSFLTRALRLSDQRATSEASCDG